VSVTGPLELVDESLFGASPWFGRRLPANRNHCSASCCWAVS